MKKYLEFFPNGFDSTVTEKVKIENWPWVGYSRNEGIAYAAIPEPVTGPADNEIWYTSSDGDVISPYKTDVFGVNLVSNTYENDKGILSFDNDVTSIGGWAFYNCTSLTSITIPNSVTSIGKEAFKNCSSLTSIVIPDGVTSIGYCAFLGCSSLISITIPEGVTSIKNQAFYNCSSLTSVTIPNSVTSIGQDAFSFCTSLTSVTIGNSVTSIEGRAFHYCSNLNSITYEGTQAQWNAITKGTDWHKSVPSTYVQCSDGQVAL